MEENGRDGHVPEKLIKNKNFVNLSAARFISITGDRIHSMALVWYVLNELGTGAAIGTVMVLTTLPSVLLGPFTGVLADRFDRRKIMLLMDSVRALAAVTLGVFIFLDRSSLALLFGVTIVLSICNALYNPTSMALFPNLVRDEQLYEANTVASFLSSLGTCIGPAVSGLIIGAIGVEGAFILNGISFILSAGFEYRMRIPYVHSDSPIEIRVFFQKIAEGFRFVKKKKAILAMLIFGMSVNFFFFPSHDVILPIIVKKILGMTPEQFGVITAMFPLGMLISTLALQVIPQPEKKHRFMIWGMFSQAMGLILLALPIVPFLRDGIPPAHFFGIFIGIGILRGLAFGFSNVPMAVVNQRLVPDEYRGRVYALQSTCYQGLIPIAYGFAGILVDILPTYFVVIMSGVGMAGVCMWMFTVKEIREI